MNKFLKAASIFFFTPWMGMTWAANSGAGTTSAGILDLGVGARAEALGEAYSAAANDATALYWNPAALTRVDGGDVTLMHAPYLDSSFYDFAGFARNGRSSAFAIGAQFDSVGQIPRTDISGTDVGNFAPNDLVLSAAFAHRFGGAALGVTGKFLRSTLDTTAQTAAIDIGYLSPRCWQDRATFAITVLNLGRGLKFDDATSPLPSVGRLGSAFDLSRNFLLTADVSFPRRQKIYEGVGVQYRVFSGQATQMSLRGGYNSRSSEGPGLSAGAGFLIKAISFDYAFLPFGALGSTHRISVSWNFGKAEKS